MALSNLQKHLIVGLRIFGVEKDAILGIVSAMETEEQQCRLMEWMSEHEGVSTAEILKVVAELARPVTKNRDKLLRTLIDQGMSNDTLLKILKPMEGKTQDQKEQIAAQIMKERGIE